MSDDNDPVISDFVDVPVTRCHDSGRSVTVFSALVSLALSIVASTILGCVYGAFISLCGERWINIGVAFAGVWWVHSPSQIAFMLTHLRDERWQKAITLVGLAVCVYAICIGWCATVLDGPGIVLNPISLVGHLMDVNVHSLWTIPWEPELNWIGPYLLALRFVELAWITFVGLMTLGVSCPYPYCQTCRKWMDDEVSVRVQYQPETNASAKNLAAEIVTERYDSLLQLNDVIEQQEKGLAINVYACGGNECPCVMDAIWFRTDPDPDKDEVDRMLESKMGAKIVAGVTVPKSIKSHFEALASVSSSKR